MMSDSAADGLTVARAGDVTAIPPGPASPDLLRQILSNLPVAVYATDGDGRIAYYNDAAAALWGRRPELGKDAWGGAWKLFKPDGSPMTYDDTPMGMAVRERRALRAVPIICERQDGARIPLAAYPTPQFDADGRLTGMVNILIDASDQRRAEEYEQRLASIVKSSDDAIVSKDLNGIVTSWNLGAEKLFDYSADEMIGRSITTVIPADRQQEEDSILARIRRGERVEHFETIRRRKDGSLVEVSLTISPIFLDGRIVGASKIARDITERRRGEERQELLFQEIKHRIKNTLAMVQAIASQTLVNLTDEERQAFFARLQALGNAHELLAYDEALRGALGDVVEHGLAAFRETHGARIATNGPSDIWLDAQQTTMLTMALHELATNALKYGALSNDSGTVSLTWERTPTGWQMRWLENGGPPVLAPQRQGFGSVLIERALESQLGPARIEFRPNGVLWTLQANVPESTAPSGR